MKKILCTLTTAFLVASLVSAQVSVINSPFQTFNVTPNSLIQASIMNASGEQQIVLESKLINVANEVVLSARSIPFAIHNGVNTSANSSRQIERVEYGNSSQASYIKTSHLLPSGRFKLCIVVISATTSEVIDDFCDEIESDLSQFLFLVSPFDKDTIATTQPLLAWTHSEPFNVLSQGESYRMILVELKNDQTAEEGIVTNPTYFLKNNLLSHQVVYPIDANKLEADKRYGWQVQKIANDIVINKSEAWEFTLASKNKKFTPKYATLNKKLSSGFYTAYDNKVYFRFVENYSSNIAKAIIYDEKRAVIRPKLKSEATSSQPIAIKNNGTNLFEIDLNSLNIQSGFHTLEIKNEKGELFLLKFLVQE
ncbi:MAG: hypothetical protein J0M08_06910 [Bacteroidetes bacterium]|nr:hypothetical protein [Bacteroidota bacterium]